MAGGFSKRRGQRGRSPEDGGSNLGDTTSSQGTAAATRHQERKEGPPKHPWRKHSLQHLTKDFWSPEPREPPLS
jgi:hypothetical protein